MRAPEDLEVARVVLQHHGDVVAGAQAGRVQQLGDALRALVELA